MKRFCVFFFLLLFSVNLFADDDDDKQKLAVMEFEDRSGNLSAKTLSDATEYIRGAFVSSNKFIVIAKERQEKALIKEMKKESYKSCNDKNCQIPLGQALSADTILRTTINFFGGVYTITSELIDLAKEATVSGAKQNFDGSEKSLMQALDRIVVQIAGTAVSYNVETMKTQEIQGVKLGGVELDTMPKIEVKEADFSDVKNTVSVKELESNTGISLDADADILVLYDKCVKADKNGEKDPQTAIDLWYQLSRIQDKNPFLNQALQRITDWKKFIYSKQMADLFEIAKNTDKTGQIFPKEAMNAWNDVYIQKNTDKSAKFDNPYEQTAKERFNFWMQYNTQVDKYRAQLQKFDEQRKQDIAKLKKVLPLEVINDAQKRTVLIQYMEIYSPFYGIEDVNAIIYSMDDALAKHLYELVYNDYLKKEMAEKCGKGNGAACYISASLTEVEDQQKANMAFAQSCERGVVNACVKTGKANYQDGQFKEAEKHFTEACGMDSPEGCHIIAYFIERGIGVISDLVLAGAIYKKACELGYDASCKPAKALAGLTPEKAAQMKQQRKDEEERRKADEARRKDEAERRKAEKEKKDKITAELNQAGRKKRLTIATTTFVSGIVVGALGGVSFYAMNEAEKDRKNYYDKYLDAVGSDADKYHKKAQDADKKRKTYLILGGVGAGLGVALITTGIVFYSIDFEGEKKVKKKYNLSFGASPMDGTLQFALRW
ncbi:sel1 repeat family protein [bacterium]|nr:sel1 repeat family protein [bacterium]